MIRDRRGDRTYLYSSEWRDGRSVRTYLGTGAVGEAAAAEVEAQRLDQRRRREALAKLERRHREALRLADGSRRACELLVTAELTAAGYHRPAHKPWRRRRVRLDQHRDHDRGRG
jgi:hypothetical protein